MLEIPFYMVDAFSDRAFGGNPAAVCPLVDWLPDATLLKMAQEHNQSETAFFVRTDGGFELRWFTTQGEINLCGHATLASAHVIFEYLDYPHAEMADDGFSGVANCAGAASGPAAFGPRYRRRAGISPRSRLPGGAGK